MCFALLVAKVITLQDITSKICELRTQMWSSANIMHNVFSAGDIEKEFPHLTSNLTSIPKWIFNTQVSFTNVWKHVTLQVSVHTWVSTHVAGALVTGVLWELSLRYNKSCSEKKHACCYECRPAPPGPISKKIFF